jgi:hypothetical protein
MYGRTVAPFWIDTVLALISTFSVVKMNQPQRWGLMFASLPVVIWLGLALFSPESFTAWHWIPDGGPREPWGVPREYSYQFRYTSYEQLVGACVTMVAIEVFLCALLATLLRSRRVHEFYRVQWPWLRRPDSA